ncbi:hypothetical protein HK27_10675 [Acetobacter orientalis]|nr:hypothetical protein HK27_10675 [Acetobacter orientalis]
MGQTPSLKKLSQHQQCHTESTQNKTPCPHKTSRQKATITLSIGTEHTQFCPSAILTAEREKSRCSAIAVQDVPQG